MKRYLYIIILINFIIVSCATTEFKKQDQLPKNVKYFDKNKVYETPITTDYQKYPTCTWCSSYKCNSEGENRKEAQSIDKYLYKKQAKIIGEYEYYKIESFKRRGRILCTGNFYLAKVENYGYLFIEKKIADLEKNKNIIAKQKKKEDEIRKKYDFHLDTLKPNDRDLINSMRFGNYMQMNVSIKNGANINTKDLYGHTPLNLASSNGFDKMVEFLLKKRADINKSNNYGITPLMSASIRGHLKIVKLLIAYRAKVNL